MVLGWTEIRSKAVAFAREYSEAERENQDYSDFWNDFFDIFGKRRRSVASFQEAIKKIGGETGFIDLFWPGVLLVEHKSAGKDLDSAFLQANDYILALREEERPRYVVVSDFKRIRLYDLEAEGGKTEQHEFPLKELQSNIRLFGFIAGYEVRKFKEEDPVNRKAVDIVVDLYRALSSGHYPKEHLSQLMIRLVFLFFADDAGIFPKRDIFYEYVQYFTKEDGSDLGSQISTIFEILNTPENKRQNALSEELKDFPYVNGSLFSNPLPLPFFDREMRREIIKAAEFDWGAVSPAIFGSMFQYVMDMEPGDIRHDFGAHYTSEKNILKVAHGLFLDELHEELEVAGQNKTKLEVLWNKIGRIKLLDPACGCGNFLVVSYRELRLIEIEIIKRIYRKEIDVKNSPLPIPVDVPHLSKLSVEKMYGIELLKFPAEIAKLSLWLIDHQMNVQLAAIFGQYFAKLPLKEQPHILYGNALAADWEKLVPKSELSYILGNPPFIAKQDQDENQKNDMKLIFGELKGAGELDYVSAWYIKAADYIQGTEIKCAFVSTNSITQGEQVGVLWSELLRRGIHINFAHRTFRWSNEARGKAAVHCVIIGFSLGKTEHPRLWDYDDPAGDSHLVEVTNINPYLVDAENVLVISRRNPLQDVPPPRFGSMPNDSGFLLFDDEKARDEFLVLEPGAEKFIRPMLSAKEYLNGELRYCLWLKGASPEELRQMPELMKKIEAVRTYRSLSKREATKKLAEQPALFGEDRQPITNYILFPRVSSERRRYIPLSFFGPENIAGDTCIVVPNATLYHFGILQSEMHMTWMRQVCGRLKSDYRYSNELVYNNFPWSEAVTKEQKKEIEVAAKNVLDARKEFPNATLSDLYDPDVMPKKLLEAHKSLDKAVDRSYGVPRGFLTEAERLKFLFTRYEELLSRVS